MSINPGSKEVSRRKFLSYIVTGIGGLIAAALATPVIGYFLSPVWKREESRAVPIARASQIPIGTPTFIRFEERVPDAWVVTTESQGLWVLTKDGQNFTVYDPHCTHLRCPYYWDDQMRMFVCPCHGGFFDIDGNVTGGPPPRPLDILESVVVGGELEITGKVIRR